MVSNNSSIYEKHEDVYKKLKDLGHDGWGGSNFSNRIIGWENNIDRIKAILPESPGCLLEIGCGTGDVSRLFHKIGFSVEGIDISEIYDSLTDDGRLIISSIISKDQEEYNDENKDGNQTVKTSIAPVERHLTSKKQLEKELQDADFITIENWVSCSEKHDHYFAVLRKS